MPTFTGAFRNLTEFKKLRHGWCVEVVPTLDQGCVKEVITLESRQPQYVIYTKEVKN